MSLKHFLTFHIDQSLFAIDTQAISEIIPMVNFTSIPKTKKYIAGLMNLRGNMTPVIDLNELIKQTPCERKICTRIIILHNNFSPTYKYTGLIAENVTNTIKLETDDFINHQLTDKQTSYLGEIIKTEQGDIQILNIDKLLPDEVNKHTQTGQAV